MNSSFRTGWAEVEWTPAPGLPLLGQMHERLATHARDPLCACAVAFQNAAQTIVIVAVDVAGLDDDFVATAQNQWATNSDFAPETLLIHATHTHVAPVSLGLLMTDALQGFQETLLGAILEAASRAIEKLEEVQVFAACGHLDFMGWNRRAMFANGTSQMYGNSAMDGFIGMEGPRDGALPLLWTRNVQGIVSGVLTGFATHPNTLESECFYSADIPGATRKYLRRALGDDIGAVYLTGAAGNTAPSQLDPLVVDQPWRGESGLERSGLYLAGEASKLIAATLEPMQSPSLRLAHAHIEIPLRPWPDEKEPSHPAPDAIGWDSAKEYYAAARAAWPRRVEQLSPFALDINVLRIGDVAICTNPAELFVEFGLEIQADSPARVTFISELTNGYCGYVPTPKAFGRGGYETWCAASSQLVPEAGDCIVAATRDLLQKAFD